MNVAPPVVHLVTALAHGGLERLVVDWTNARNRQWPGSTRIACLDEAGELAAQVKGGAVTVIGAARARKPWDREAVARVRAMATDHRPVSAVIHAHNMAAWQYAVLAARGTGSRVVYTQHGANTHNLGLKDRVRGQWLAWMGGDLVAVSEATARAMEQAFWIRRGRIRVIANGIAAAGAGDAPCTEPTRIRAELGIPDEALVLGSVGRLAQVKGYDRLIRALGKMRAGVSQPSLPSAVHRPLPPVHLLLVGDGPERAALERLAASLGLADRVRLAGFQADPRPYLAAMDAFILSSHSEGLSMGLLEAMAAGIPVFVTDVGANREVVEAGACGVVLPADEGAWAGVLAEWLADREGRLAMAARARDRVREHYTQAATLAGYEALYARAAGMNGGGVRSA